MTAADHRRVVFPGEPTPRQAAWAQFQGHPGGGPPERDRARRLGLIGDITEVTEAWLELGSWRTRIRDTPPGPALVAAVADRPDALAPAPLNDPNQALAVAHQAGAAGAADRVVTVWANAVLDSITARARVLSWLQAEQYTDLAMLSRNYPGLHEMLPTEIAFALRTSETTAGNAISTARAITGRLPHTLHALRNGLIDADHAMAMIRATATTTADVAARVEADLLPEVTAPGSSTTAEQLRRRAARAVIKHDPNGATERHQLAAADRTVTRWAEDDGMAGLKVLAPAQQVAAIWEASTALADADKFPGDTRTLGNRRVDALTQLCTDLLRGTVPHRDEPTPCPAAPRTRSATDTPAQAPAQAPADAPREAPSEAPSDPTDETSPPMLTPATPSGDPQTHCDPAEAGTDPHSPGATTDNTVPAPPPSLSDPQPLAPSQPPGPTARPITLPTQHGRRPQIQVVIPYTVLLGSDDPCELVGHGAITADQARMITADGTVQRLLCDPASGTLLDYGRTRYQPPETLKQFLITRDGTCRAPGCNQPAARCQIDHIEPFHPGQPTGGNTNHLNLDAKCAHHHRGKDGGGFSNTRDPNGTSHWTTPLGRHYTLPANRLWNPDHTEPNQYHPFDSQPPRTHNNAGIGYRTDNEESPRPANCDTASAECDEPPPF